MIYFEKKNVSKKQRNVLLNCLLQYYILIFLTLLFNGQEYINLLTQIFFNIIFNKAIKNSYINTNNLFYKKSIFSNLKINK